MYHNEVARTGTFAGEVGECGTLAENSIYEEQEITATGKSGTTFNFYQENDYF